MNQKWMEPLTAEKVCELLRITPEKLDELITGEYLMPEGGKFAVLQVVGLVQDSLEQEDPLKIPIWTSAEASRELGKTPAFLGGLVKEGRIWAFRVMRDGTLKDVYLPRQVRCVHEELRAENWAINHAAPKDEKKGEKKEGASVHFAAEH